MTESAPYWWFFLGAAVFAPHLGLLAFAKALNFYSRRRLEERCETRDAGATADEVAHYDERTARAAEALFVVSGLLLAAVLGEGFARTRAWGAAVGALPAIVALLGIGYLLAGVVGRVFAESVIVAFWPTARFLRWSAFPLTYGVRRLERWVARLASEEDAGARPASVEVEVPAESEDDQDVEAELPEKARELLEHAVALTRTEVHEIMTPRSSVVSLPSTVTAGAAADAFRRTGLSRIPIYGVNRDDVLGILYAKDLFPALTDPNRSEEVEPADLVRPPLFVPESKNAFTLLEEFRDRRVQFAVILDEYGGAAGIVTFEDLLEELVGFIDDEHDVPTPDNPIRAIDDSHYEVDAALPVDRVNEELHLRIPSHDDFQTIGGLAFHSLGRVPDEGDSFEIEGAALTVAEVSDHKVRRLIIELKSPESSAGAR